MVISTRVRTFPNFGKNLTTPYAPSAEMVIAIKVVAPATIMLFITLLPKPNCPNTVRKLSKVMLLGKNEVGSPASSPLLFTEESNIHSSGKMAIMERTVR